MKELKNKEVVIGLVIIIILAVIAIGLIVRRERKPEVLEQAQSLPTVEEELSISALPEEETIEEEAPQEPVAVEEVIDQGQTQPQTQAATMITGDNSAAIGEKEAEGITLYSILGKETYTPAVMKDRKVNDGQLKELYGYWKDYHLEAVEDLIHLDRIRKISDELTGTNGYYYYGDLDSLGRPDGHGLAVYADDTYYCGEWNNGLREGDGMWLQAVIYDETNKAKNLGLAEHMYNGEWSKDLPNGEGQEHFEYDFDVLKVENFVIANVVGGFKDGYYHGEMYIMTVTDPHSSKDWYGNCKRGEWQIFHGGSVTDAVWRDAFPDEKGDYEYHYMFPRDQSNQGIFGLKKS
ncbi:MAG: hypothetical protein IJC59_02775 [Lachnospiraceae bacterium]|nr:hypothetical protein [Lachnospiraceae bacterium]